MKTRLIGALLAAIAGSAAPQVPDISSFAFVRDDATLEVAGYWIRLYGIYVPPTDRTCYTFIRPIPCGTRASLALDFKISGYFVHCTPLVSNVDGSTTAACSVDGEDLSAWMLQNGWAMAVPGAPFEYVAMERLAQSKGIGIWGIPIDTFRRSR